MNDLRNEAERLAALLDGRLGAKDRAEMLAHLAANQDAYEVFARLAAILRRIEEEDACAHADGMATVEERASASGDGSVPLSLRRGAIKRPPALRWLTLAAALTGIALARTMEPLAPAASDPVLAARLEYQPTVFSRSARDRPWAGVR